MVAITNGCGYYILNKKVRITENNQIKSLENLTFPKTSWLFLFRVT